MYKIDNLYYRINALVLFSGFKDIPGIKSFLKLSEAYLEYKFEDEDDYDDQFEALNRIIKKYSAFVKDIYEGGGDLGHLVKTYINTGDNLYVSKHISGDLNPEIESALKNELKTLQALSDLTSEDFIGLIDENFSIFKNSSVDLPKWSNSKINVKKEFDALLKNISTKGYGVFSENNVFKVRNNNLVPVKNVDAQSLEQLYGYDRERNLVLENTKALALGKPASNVLLYGDAGTGKSTTVKAAALHFAPKGVRLIEFNKNEVGLIPDIAENLAGSPLKFIFFIDDLTFSDNDENYYALKGILEGNVSGTAPNILIYATSNRRHLVKESMADRQGDDLHLNDTLQETMSLSSRFGLTITFSKPAKDLYLSIVENLAIEHGLIKKSKKKADKELENLFSRAEAFAIRSNGRSPRTAKQFVVLAKNGLA